MLKSEIKEICLLQNKKMPSKPLIERDVFEFLEKQIDNPFIIIIKGIRRCGKSTLLMQLMDKHPGYYLNFDDERLAKFDISDFELLDECFMEIYGEKEFYYFDEIQNIAGWERFARRLHNEKKKLFITGSNATMLGYDLGTHLTGRHLLVNVFPFSFKEFLAFNNAKYSVDSVGKEKSQIINFLNEYINSGGFPEYLSTKNVEYLKTLFDNLLYRDVLVRHKITSEKTMRDVINFIATNLSKEISFNSIKAMLNLGSSTTVKDYFGFLENSFLIYLVSKSEFSVKKQMYANKKTYFIDTGMAGYLGTRFSQDKGRLFENLIFIELKRRKKEVFFHKDKCECDFICSNSASVAFKPDLLIQACYELTEQNKEREITGLLEAAKMYKQKEGLILTLDQEDEFVAENKKIKVIPAWKWLIN